MQLATIHEPRELPAAGAALTVLVSIGPRAAGGDLVDLLLACHERIRRFVRLAEEVGRRDDVDDAEVIDACQRCERYFAEALPLHVADEEDSLVPRLRGISAEVDAALATMHAEHAAHPPLLGAFLDAARAVQAAPGDRARRARLGEAAARLAAAFAPHLAIEEQVLFPAIRAALSDADRAAIVRELRARRGGATSPPP